MVHIGLRAHGSSGSTHSHSSQLSLSFLKPSGQCMRQAGFKEHLSIGSTVGSSLHWHLSQLFSSLTKPFRQGSWHHSFGHILTGRHSQRLHPLMSFLNPPGHSMKHSGHGASISGSFGSGLHSQVFASVVVYHVTKRTFDGAQRWPAFTLFVSSGIWTYKTDYINTNFKHDKITKPAYRMTLILIRT